jgi:D-ribose pyranase
VRLSAARGKVMKKSGLLNHRLSEVIARMGHTQRLVIADAGLPIPLNVERIDLSVAPGIPSVLDLATAIAGELQVEGLVFAEELLARDTSLPTAIGALFPGASTNTVPHDEFKRLTGDAVAVVRTGECTPYANVMLISGVTF